MINGTTIELATPITIGELSLRKIRLGDIKAISVCQTEIAAVGLLASRLAGVDIELIRSLEMVDTETMMDAIIAELKSCQKIQ